MKQYEYKGCESVISIGVFVVMNLYTSGENHLGYCIIELDRDLFHILK